jgi:glycosyltransferase involved in cell wall biosynthesis
MQAAEMRRFELLPRFDPVVLPPVFPAARPPMSRAVASNYVSILSAGRLVPVKQFGVVVDMAHRLRDLPCRFVIAGDGPQREALQARVGALGLDQRVQFVGGLRNLEPLLSTADIFLHPALYESFGIVVLEAMQAGIPVMLDSRSLIGCRESLDAQQVTVADFSRPARAASQLRSLILDPTLRTQVGNAGQCAAAALLSTDYTVAFRRLIAGMIAPRMLAT